MKPVEITPIGNELAIKWDDGAESFIPLRRLREACPCAACKGETDIMGNVYGGGKTSMSPAAFQIVRVSLVGGYGIQPTWADGHGSGIFPFEVLKVLSS